jgi:hypothetical protein
LPSGQTRNQLIHVSDILPTLSTLAGVKFYPKSQIDGIDQTKMLINGKEMRNEVMFVDDSNGYGSFIHNNYKLVNGTQFNGAYDNWIGVNNKGNINSLQYAANVLNSSAGKALGTWKRFLNAPIISKLRSNAILKCASKTEKRECNLLKAPCLFDISKDPCEENNLADVNQTVLIDMQNRFSEKLKNAAQSRRKPSDARADPTNFNNTWSWWEADSEL